MKPTFQTTHPHRTEMNRKIKLKIRFISHMRHTLLAINLIRSEENEREKKNNNMRNNNIETTT